jgi:signal transduction histidine kinase
MRETQHRRVVLTDWVAAAVGIAGLGSAGTQIGDPALVGMVPILASLLGWLFNRIGHQVTAGVILFLGCVLGSLVGIVTPEVGHSVVAEVMWLTMGTILGIYLLPLRHYAVFAGGIVILMIVGTIQNPEISVQASLYFCGFLTIIVALGIASIQFVEQQDERVEAREAELRTALESARQRAEDLALARTDLNETRSQLVHLGRLASLGEVAAEVAHELNNPLTTVLMSSEVLRDELRPQHAELAQVAGEVLSAAQACANVTERVLWYGRRQAPLRTPVSLCTVVEHALVITRAPVVKARCSVRVEVDEHTMFIGDTVQLTQVFVNLIINAMSVMAHGGVIHIHGGMDGEMVWATVEDDGPGVPADHKETIFAPFFTTRTDQGGSGLGLAISRAVIETHGGRLTLETVRPAPARFRIDLPLDVAPEVPAGLEVHTPPRHAPVCG